MEEVPLLELPDSSFDDCVKILERTLRVGEVLEDAVEWKAIDLLEELLNLLIMAEANHSLLELPRFQTVALKSFPKCFMALTGRCAKLPASIYPRIVKFLEAAAGFYPRTPFWLATESVTSFVPLFDTGSKIYSQLSKTKGDLAALHRNLASKFVQNGGLAAFLAGLRAWMSAETATTTTTTSSSNEAPSSKSKPSILLMENHAFIIYLLRSTLDFSSQFRDVHDLCISYFQSLTDDDLKNSSYKNLDSIILSIDYVGATCKLKSHFEEERWPLIAKYYKSPFLKNRLIGLAEMKALIKVIDDTHPSEEKKIEILTDKFIVNIKAHEIIPHTFGPMMHLEMLTRFSRILQFLFYNGEYCSREELFKILSSTNGTHWTMKKALVELIVTTLGDMDLPTKLLLSEYLASCPAESWSESLVTLTDHLVVQLEPHMSQANVSKAIQALLGQLFNVVVVNIVELQHTSDFATSVLVRLLAFKHISTFMPEIATSSIHQLISLSSIRMNVYFLHHLCHQTRTPQLIALQSQIFEVFVQNDVFSVLLNVLDYAANLVVQNIEASDQGASHLLIVDHTLKFLEFLISLIVPTVDNSAHGGSPGSSIFDKEKVSKFWDLLVKLSPHSAGQTIIFDFFKRYFFVDGPGCAIDASSRYHLLKEKVPELDFRYLQAGPLSSLLELFRSVNISAQCLVPLPAGNVPLPAGNQLLSSFQLNKDALIGESFLWKVSLTAENLSVAQEAMKFLVSLYVNVSDSLKDSAEHICTAFVENCLSGIFALELCKMSDGESKTLDSHVPDLLADADSVKALRSLQILHIYLTSFISSQQPLLRGIHFVPHGSSSLATGEPLRVRFADSNNSFTYDVSCYGSDTVRTLLTSAASRFPQTAMNLTQFLRYFRFILTGKELSVANLSQTLESLRLVDGALVRMNAKPDAGNFTDDVSVSDSAALLLESLNSTLSGESPLDLKAFAASPLSVLSQPQYFTKLFSLLGHMGPLAELAWKIILLLPTNKEVGSNVVTLDYSKSVAVSYYSDPLAHTLYFLQAMYKSIQLEFSSSESTFAKSFVSQNGGFWLVTLLLKIDSLKLKSSDIWSPSIVLMICHILNALVQSPDQSIGAALFASLAPLTSSFVPYLMRIVQNMVYEAPVISKAMPLFLDTELCNSVEPVTQFFRMYLCSDLSVSQTFLSQPNLRQWCIAVVLETPSLKLRTQASSFFVELASHYVSADFPWPVGSGPSLETTQVPLSVILLDILMSQIGTLVPPLPNCEQIFSLVDILLIHYHKFCQRNSLDIEHSLLPISSYCQMLVTKIRTAESVEATPALSDPYLLGVLVILKRMLFGSKTIKHTVGNSMSLALLGYVFEDCLFQTPLYVRRRGSGPPKCKSQKTRLAAFDLLTDLCKGTPSNLLDMANLLFRNTVRAERVQGVWDYTPASVVRNKTGYSGLVNQGATCYMNSLLQQLFMTPGLRNSLLTVSKKEGSDAIVLGQLQKLFVQLLETDRKSVNTRELCLNYTHHGQKMKMHEQMDVDEFMAGLFDKLEKEVSDPAVLTLHFGGKSIQQIVSKDCEHVSERIEGFYALPCTVKGKRNIYQSLDSFIEEELLDGDNKYHCGTCDRKVAAVKRAGVHSLPEVLILNLKRLEFDMETGNRYKVNDFFEFPEELDLSKYLIASSNKPASEVDASETDVSNASSKYRLVGMLCHIGGAESGHYYSFIKEREPLDARSSHEPAGAGSNWFKFNDSNVSEFDFNDLSREGFGGSYHEQYLDRFQRQMYREVVRNYSAYLLFYERIPAFDTQSSPSYGGDPVDSMKDDTAGSERRSSRLGLSPNRTIQDCNIEASSGQRASKRGRLESYDASLSSLQSLFELVWRDNAYFQSDIQVYDSDNFEFVVNICSELAKLEDASCHTLSIKVAAQYLFEVVAHSGFKKFIKPLSELVITLCKSSEENCIWVLDHLLGEQGHAAHQLFLSCHLTDIRSFITKVVLEAIKGIQAKDQELYGQTILIPPSSSTGSPLLLPVSEASPMVESSTVGETQREDSAESLALPASRSFRLLHYLLKVYLPHSYAVYDNLHDLFDFCHKFCLLGEPEFDYFLSEGYFDALLQFFLGENSPLEIDEEFGTPTKRFVNPHYQGLVSIILMVITKKIDPSIIQMICHQRGFEETLLSIDQEPQAIAPLTRSSFMLLFGGSNRQAPRNGSLILFNLLVFHDVNPGAMHEVFKRLMFDDESNTFAIIESLFKFLRTLDIHSVKPFFAALEYICTKIPDQLEAARVQHVISHHGFLLNKVKVLDKFLGMLCKLASTCVPVREHLSETFDKWMPTFILHHNTAVRQSTKRLISLLMSPLRVPSTPEKTALPANAAPTSTSSVAELDFDEDIAFLFANDSDDQVSDEVFYQTHVFDAELVLPLFSELLKVFYHATPPYTRELDHKIVSLYVQYFSLLQKVTMALPEVVTGLLDGEEVASAFVSFLDTSEFNFEENSRELHILICQWLNANDHTAKAFVSTQFVHKYLDQFSSCLQEPENDAIIWGISAILDLLKIIAFKCPAELPGVIEAIMTHRTYATLYSLLISSFQDEHAHLLPPMYGLLDAICNHPKVCSLRLLSSFDVKAGSPRSRAKIYSLICKTPYGRVRFLEKFVLSRFLEECSRFSNVWSSEREFYVYLLDLLDYLFCENLSGMMAHTKLTELRSAIRFLFETLSHETPQDLVLRAVEILSRCAEYYPVDVIMQIPFLLNAYRDPKLAVVMGSFYPGMPGDEYVAVVKRGFELRVVPGAPFGVDPPRDIPCQAFFEPYFAMMSKAFRNMFQVFRGKNAEVLTPTFVGGFFSLCVCTALDASLVGCDSPLVVLHEVLPYITTFLIDAPFKNSVHGLLHSVFLVERAVLSIPTVPPLIAAILKTCVDKQIIEPSFIESLAEKICSSLDKDVEFAMSSDCLPAMLPSLLPNLRAMAVLCNLVGADRKSQILVIASIVSSALSAPLSPELEEVNAVVQPLLQSSLP